ncbi:TIGR03086 family metal-binding protein [Amycolatopsis decaplanina]|uniref:TIGR03086 family metal-binding protein n=1 Tax=Amycolatopsis decaplanina TaxID=208441 RepID=UPI00034B3A17|nr:TIGR03086 family metal-binding protein [Amycolatopsis decaplanina]
MGFADGTRLLEGSIVYALVVLTDISDADLERSTPCSEWNLRELLWHVNESMADLHEGIVTGGVELFEVVRGATVPAPMRMAEPRGTAQVLASRLLSVVSMRGSSPSVSIGDRPLDGGVAASVGAIEVAAHAWDISHACGHNLDVPKQLARDLLELSHDVIPEPHRSPFFAPPVKVGPSASETDKFVAFLGRMPG